MKRFKKRAPVLAAALAAAVVGGGAALAGAQDGSSTPSEFFDSVARHLGISPEKLEDATKAAAIDQVDAALEEGKITKARADELKARIESGEGPLLFGPGLFGHPHGGPHGLGDKLSAAADYLGLSVDQLHERLRAGRSLADIAQARGKSVDGLEQAILDEAKKGLDEAVSNGRLTREEADEVFEDLEARVDDMVKGTFQDRHRGGRFFDDRLPGSESWGTSAA